MSGLLVVGAGGHGRVVADAAEESAVWKRIAFLDDRYPELFSSGEWPVIGVATTTENWFTDFQAVIVAVGDNRLRLQLSRRFAELGYTVPQIVHPTAYVGRCVEIGAGSVLLAQSAINVGARVGEACIVNTAAVIEHDCVLGDGVHVSPGAALAGAVDIGDCAWVGIGASVKQEVRIGADAIVATGAAVVRDVAVGRTAGGVPARLLGRGEEGKRWDD